MAQIFLDGNPSQTHGELPEVGEQAPDFRLVDQALKTRSLADYAGKKKILSINPSLDTGVCQQVTRRFDDLAAENRGVVFLTISADLPFAAHRFCSSSGADHVVTLSMMRSRSFAKDYGVLIQDGPFEGLAARAVVVLDETDRVLYSELVREIADEPDYDRAVAALA